MDDSVIGLLLGFAIGLTLTALIAGSNPIHDDELNYAEEMCEPNGGIKKISHFEIRCSNGATFRWK